MLDVIMVVLLIILPTLMLGLTKWSSKLVDQGREEQ